jgi:anaerobic ribonucleoside-triphosphate reductase activating protein
VILKINRFHYPVTTLGPGNRIGIWFQGCAIHCQGCISPDTWSSETGEIELSVLMSRVLGNSPGAEGITISGGEPFDQPLGLKALLDELRRSMPDTNILVFTGYQFDVAARISPESMKLIDALVSGPFEQSTPQTLPLRGSDNQQLHFLSENGAELFSRYKVPSSEKALDIMFDEDGTVWLAGIPRRGDMDKLAGLLHASGMTLSPVSLRQETTASDTHESRQELKEQSIQS